MKIKRVLISIIVLILLTSAVSCLPGITDDTGRLLVKFYGNRSEKYGEFKITIDKIEIHARGGEWKEIGADKIIINIISNEVSNTPLKEFSHGLLEGVLKKGVEYTEIRFCVTEVKVVPKMVDYSSDIEYLPVIIPRDYKDGYKFPIELTINSFSKNYPIKINFDPDTSIKETDEEYELNLGQNLE